MQESRVLVVDDDFIVNLNIRELLQAGGADVESVYCASAAFEAIDRHPRPSALVTDIELGPGPSGFDVARYARAAYPTLPVVYVSGTSMWRHMAEGVPGSEFLNKPLRLGGVEAALKRLLRVERGRVAPRAAAADDVLPLRWPSRRPQLASNLGSNLRERVLSY